MINTTILTFVLLAEIILLIGIFIWILKTENRLKKFFKGKKAISLENDINTLLEETKKLDQAKTMIEKDILKMKEEINRSIKNIKTIRFNPFGESGGSQSFAISFLDDKGDGVIISSLYSRERMSVFAKPIKSHKSDFELTEEEKSIIKE